jgi:hypothetical protein
MGIKVRMVLRRWGSKKRVDVVLHFLSHNRTSSLNTATQCHPSAFS